MITDPLYRAIIAALVRSANDRENALDDTAFEVCMAELLKPTFPGIVPVRGGGDGGMDGSIPDLERHGPSSPLICTTGGDAIGNLTRNLEVRRSAEPSGSAVFVTSRRLTPNQRANLETRAKEMDYSLRQIYQLEDVASLLYRNPLWAKELLRVSGQLPALSELPPRAHYATRDRNEFPIGRDSDLEYLRSAVGDTLLIGPPGAGKTHLLAHLAREEWGLFATVDDVDAILDEVRASSPKRIIVDDAATRVDLLKALVHAREVARFDASIVATCWGHEATDIATIFGPKVAVRRLELLTRDEIVKVYESFGLPRDKPWMRALVDQADNKPGLAATLATAVLAGDVRRVVTGDALRDHILFATKAAVSIDVALFLAAFAFGGDMGMRLVDVANVLNESLGTVRKAASKLGSCGVLSYPSLPWPTKTGTYCVRPPALRGSLLNCSLVADILADQRVFAELLERAPDKRSVAEGFASGARHHTSLPATLVRSIVQEHGSGRAWEMLASTKEHASWVLSEYSGSIEHVARAALHVEPVAVIDRLLAAAAAQADSTRSSERLGVLADWLASLRGPIEPVRRRQVLSARSVQFAADGGDMTIAQRAVLLALSPVLSEWGADPGSGGHLTWHRRLLCAAEVRELHGVWLTSQSLFSELRLPWVHVKTALRDLVYPGGSGEPLDAEKPDEQAEEMRALASRILSDLWKADNLGLGTRVGMIRLASRLGLLLQGDEETRVFGVLFPDETGDSTQDPPPLEALAKTSSADTPNNVAQWLINMERAAAELDYFGPHRTLELSELIAERVADPPAWIEALALHRELSGLLAPFLARLLASRPAAWERLLMRLLTDESTKHTAAQLAFCESDLPPEIEARLLTMASEVCDPLWGLALRGELPVARVSMLLDHEDPTVRLVAATGEWLAAPERTVREPLFASWRRALLRAGVPGRNFRHHSAKYFLGELLASDSELALEWLRACLPELPVIVNNARGPVARAARALSERQRIELLNAIRVATVAHGGSPLRTLLPLVVGREPAAYRALLLRAELRDFQGFPLFGYPDEKWSLLAALALNHGLDAQQVVNATIQHPDTVAYGQADVGTGAERWHRWRAGFDAILTATADPGVQEAARLGTAECERRSEEAQARWKAAEIEGL